MKKLLSKLDIGFHRELSYKIQNFCGNLNGGS